jgi:hypothetical protein
MALDELALLRASSFVGKYSEQVLFNAFEIGIVCGWSKVEDGKQTFRLQCLECDCAAGFTGTVEALDHPAQDVNEIEWAVIGEFERQLKETSAECSHWKVYKALHQPKSKDEPDGDTGPA